MSLYGRPAGPFPGQPQDPWQGAQAPDPDSGSHGFRAHEPQRYDQWGGTGYDPPPPAHEWGPPQAPQGPGRSGSGLLIGLAVVLALLVIGGGGTALYLLSRDTGGSVATGGPSTLPSASAPSVSATSTTPSAAPTGVPNTDTRNAKVGDCLVNRGTENKPDMRKVECATETYQVLKRLDGTADRKKCDGTPNLTDWYYFDSPDPASDFVLCLKKR